MAPSLSFSLSCPWRSPASGFSAEVLRPHLSATAVLLCHNVSKVMYEGGCPIFDSDSKFTKEPRTAHTKQAHKVTAPN